MNTLAIFKGLFLLTLTTKFVLSDDGESNQQGEGSFSGDISSIDHSGSPDIWYLNDDHNPQTPEESTPAEIPQESTPSGNDDDELDIIVHDDQREESSQGEEHKEIPKEKKDDDDIFSSSGRFPDGWHTYQGGNQLRGHEEHTEKRKKHSEGSVPMKTEKKEKKIKTKEKVTKDTGMPVGAIATMVTAGCVLVVAVAVAITIRK